MKVDIFSECFHNVEPFRPEVYVAPGLVSSKVPYLVGLVETENPKTIICAGSLLNYRWVLTLASCTQEKKHNNKKYKVGGILKAKTKYLFLKKSNRLWRQDLMKDPTFSSQSKKSLVMNFFSHPENIWKMTHGETTHMI